MTPEQMIVPTLEIWRTAGDRECKQFLSQDGQSVVDFEQMCATTKCRDLVEHGGKLAESTFRVNRAEWVNTTVGTALAVLAGLQSSFCEVNEANVFCGEYIDYQIGAQAIPSCERIAEMGNCAPKMFENGALLLNVRSIDSGCGELQSSAPASL